MVFECPCLVAEAKSLNYRGKSLIVNVQKYAGLNIGQEKWRLRLAQPPSLTYLRVREKRAVGSFALRAVEFL